MKLKNKMKTILFFSFSFLNMCHGGVVLKMKTSPFSFSFQVIIIITNIIIIIILLENCIMEDEREKNLQSDRMGKEREEEVEDKKNEE